METSTLVKSAVLGLSIAVSTSAAAMDCDDVIWQSAVLSKYPNIADYCKNVTEINGKPYVELDAKFISVRSNQAHIQFQDRNGDYGTTFVTKELPESFHVMVDGKPTSLRRVERNTLLNIYMPADRFVVLADPETPYNSVDLAMASYDDMLPATASSLPLLGLLGGLACGIGLLLSAVRRTSRNPS